MQRNEKRGIKINGGDSRFGWPVHNITPKTSSGTSPASSVLHVEARSDLLAWHSLHRHAVCVCLRVVSGCPLGGLFLSVLHVSSLLQHCRQRAETELQSGPARDLTREKLFSPERGKASWWKKHVFCRTFPHKTIHSMLYLKMQKLNYM